MLHRYLWNFGLSGSPMNVMNRDLEALGNLLCCDIVFGNLKLLRVSVEQLFNGGLVIVVQMLDNKLWRFCITSLGLDMFGRDSIFLCYLCNGNIAIWNFIELWQFCPPFILFFQGICFHTLLNDTVKLLSVDDRKTSLLMIVYFIVMDIVRNLVF